MRSRNARGQSGTYHPLVQVLHWGIFVAMAGEYALAWLMPKAHRGTPPDALLSAHDSLGLLLLVLTLLRLAVRALTRAPRPSRGAAPWQTGLAHFTHVTLYVAVLLTAAMGWASAARRGWEISLFGLGPLPALCSQDDALCRSFGHYHHWAAYTVAGLVGLHLLGVLFHMLLLRDQILVRMLPRSS